jgi:hypothetical protein
MAEREGFEPSVPLLTAHTISSRAPSASSDISPNKNGDEILVLRLFIGGEGGIRTHDPVFDRIPLFESGALSRSATSPHLIILTHNWVQYTFLIRHVNNLIYSLNNINGYSIKPPLPKIFVMTYRKGMVKHGRSHPF